MDGVLCKEPEKIAGNTATRYICVIELKIEMLMRGTTICRFTIDSISRKQAFLKTTGSLNEDSFK